MAYYPITVSDEFLQKIFAQNNSSELTIDLAKQTITIDATGDQETFDINIIRKTCMLNGYDDIDYLLSIRSDIETFEKQESQTP
jgi:3-isopropylmalate/(R)-2-methylmalate dehydratase small subunit